MPMPDDTPKRLIVVGDRVLIAPEEGEERTNVGLYLPPTAIETRQVQGGRIVVPGGGGAGQALGGARRASRRRAVPQGGRRGPHGTAQGVERGARAAPRVPRVPRAASRRRAAEGGGMPGVREDVPGGLA